MSMAATPARILVIAPNWLGDAVLALPALRLLVDAGAHLEVLVRRGVTRVLVDAIAAGTLRELPSRGRVQRFAHAWRLRRRGFAAAVVLPPSWSAASLAWASAARVRVGERGFGRVALLSDALQPAGRNTHLALAYQRLAGHALQRLDIPRPPSTAREASADPERDDAPPGLYAVPRLRVHAHEAQAAARLFETAGLAADATPLIVAPGARFGPAKRYPNERFARVLGPLSARLEAPVILVGGPSDRDACGALATYLQEALDFAGRTDLGTLLGVLARSRAVLSNDSGVMHLAAALGRPVVGIFGSTNPLWTRPLGPHATWVSNPVACAPCYRRTCPIDFPCMLGLEPQVIVDKLLALLGLAPGDIGAAPTRL